MPTRNDGRLDRIPNAGLAKNDHRKDALRQDLGRPPDRRRRGRNLPDLCRSPPRARGDQPAGLRGPAPERAQGACAREDACRRRSQRADDRPQPWHREPRIAHPGGRTRQERQGFRRRVLQRARPSPGHRPHHRPGTGLHPAGHDHRLRRQPYLDPRRLRRARARHRHLRGRARPRHPDADPEEGQEHADHRRRHAAAGGDRQGHHPRHHRRDRHGRRYRPRHGVCRRGDSPASRWKAA